MLQHSPIYPHEYKKFSLKLAPKLKFFPHVELHTQEWELLKLMSAIKSIRLRLFGRMLTSKERLLWMQSTKQVTPGRDCKTLSQQQLIHFGVIKISDGNLLTKAHWETVGSLHLFKVLRAKTWANSNHSSSTLRRMTKEFMDYSFIVLEYLLPWLLMIMLPLYLAHS